MQSFLILLDLHNTNRQKKKKSPKLPSYLYYIHPNMDLRNCGIAESEWWQG